MQAHWAQVRIIDSMEPSIQYLELYALAVAVAAWIDHYRNMQVKVFCDNNSVVAMINNTTSSCRNCMVLIRILVLKCLIANVRLQAKFVDAKSNAIADSLSRFQMQHFHQLTKHLPMEEVSMSVPDILSDARKLWVE